MNLDYIATGHYAAIKWIKDQDNKHKHGHIPYLVQSKETKHDQTYFLSQINGECLYNHLFYNYYKIKSRKSGILHKLYQ